MMTHRRHQQFLLEGVQQPKLQPVAGNAKGGRRPEEGDVDGRVQGKSERRNHRLANSPRRANSEAGSNNVNNDDDDSDAVALPPSPAGHPLVSNSSSENVKSIHDFVSNLVISFSKSNWMKNIAQLKSKI
jgi:hypothetical protein